MQLHLTLDVDLDAPMAVRTRPDGSAFLRLGPAAIVVSDASVFADSAEIADLTQTLVNADGLRDARQTLSFARRPDRRPAPA